MKLRKIYRAIEKKEFDKLFIVTSESAYKASPLDVRSFVPESIGWTIDQRLRYASRNIRESIKAFKKLYPKAIKLPQYMRIKFLQLNHKYYTHVYVLMKDSFYEKEASISTARTNGTNK